MCGSTDHDSSFEDWRAKEIAKMFEDGTIPVFEVARSEDEPCLCGTPFTCMATAHFKGRA
jgi:hypothetical protein